MSNRESEFPPDPGSQSAAAQTREEQSGVWALGDGAGRALNEIPHPPQSHVRATPDFELDGVDILAVTNDLQRWLG